MKKNLSHCAQIILPALILVSTSPVCAAETLDAGRIREIAAWLPAHPAGFAWPISNRPAWQKLAADPAFVRTIAGANKLLAKPLADVPDSLFLEYSTQRQPHALAEGRVCLARAIGPAHAGRGV